MSQTPNRRVQDGVKKKLLCGDCEQKIGNYEASFAAQIFLPYQEDPSHQTTYDEYLIKFATSLSWRVLLFSEEDGRNATLAPFHQDNIKKALERWRLFLNDEEDNPGVYEQHMLPLGPIDDFDGPTPASGINYYFLRSISMDLLRNDRNAIVFAKLPSFVFFGFLVPPAKGEWIGTRINLCSGSFGPRAFKIPAAIGEYWESKAAGKTAILCALSPNQKAKVEKAWNKPIDEIRNSKTFEAMSYDKKLVE
jgi:hypothetical protein